MTTTSPTSAWPLPANASTAFNLLEMVKHIVTFRLNGTPEERHEACRKFAGALLALPAQIDCLMSMEVGINENPAEQWDLVLTATVPTMADVAVYSAHPAHVAAASIIAPLRRERACVDYTGD